MPGSLLAVGAAVMPLAAGSQVPYSIVNTTASPPPAAAPASVPAAPSAAPSSAPAAPQIVSTTNAAPATTTVVTPPYADPALTGETLFASADAPPPAGQDAPNAPKHSGVPAQSGPTHEALPVAGASTAVPAVTSPAGAASSASFTPQPSATATTASSSATAQPVEAQTAAAALDAAPSTSVVTANNASDATGAVGGSVNGPTGTTGSMSSSSGSNVSPTRKLRLGIERLDRHGKRRVSGLFHHPLIGRVLLSGLVAALNQPDYSTGAYTIYWGDGTTSSATAGYLGNGIRRRQAAPIPIPSTIGPRGIMCGSPVPTTACPTKASIRLVSSSPP